MSKKQKVYAVRAGNQTGLFDSWAACEASIRGYSGAEFKAFSSVAEAKDYLAGTKKQPADDAKLPEFPQSDDTLTVYVDGSYDDGMKVYAFGCVCLLSDGRVLTYYGNGTDEASCSMRNVSGELIGAMYAVLFAIKNRFSALDLCYDYAGIEKWAVGEWKTNKELTKKYADFMKRQSRYIDVRYHKVCAHTNQTYNEMADQAAKRGLKEGNGIPDVCLI